MDINARRRHPPGRRRDREPHSIDISTGTPAVTAPPEGSGRSLFSDDVWRGLARALRLSGRESEIIQAVFDDQKETVIATNLGISAHTVHTHLERLYRKLHVSSRVSLVVRVLAEYMSNRPG